MIPNEFTTGLIWDFLVGTTTEMNFDRMVSFYEANENLSENAGSGSVKFSEFYAEKELLEENFSHPTMTAYKCAHLD